MMSKRSPFMNALGAGAVYFALVFTLGFAFGTGRVLLLEPQLGALRAVALETPLILAASWLACLFVIGRMAVEPNLPARLSMGLCAFSLLITAEFALAVVAFARTPADFAGDLMTPAGLLGLLAQMIFAAFPALYLLGSSKAGQT
jgi:hypothetical protein